MQQTIVWVRRFFVSLKDKISPQQQVGIVPIRVRLPSAAQPQDYNNNNYGYPQPYTILIDE